MIPFCDQKNMNTNNKISAVLYSKNEDFKVYELSSVSNSNFNSKPFAELKLTKKGISTFDAIINLAKFLNIPKDKISYSGLKDTEGITSQKITLPRRTFINNKSALEKKKFKKFLISFNEFVSEPKQIGQLEGNSFEVVLRDIEKNKNKVKYKLDQFSNYLKNNKLPNFYGPQRFGKRQNNHRIGKAIIKTKYEKALKIFLTEYENEDESIKKIRRKILSCWRDWENVLKILDNTQKLQYEKTIINYLIKNPTDFLGALLKIPIINFFVVSYSSYLYNIALASLLNKSKLRRVNLVGYDSKINNKMIRKRFKSILNKEKISRSMFKNKDHPLFSFAGSSKRAFYKVNYFDHKFINGNLHLYFDLPRGVYASLFLDNLIKNKIKKTKLE